MCSFQWIQKRNAKSEDGSVSLATFCKCVRYGGLARNGELCDVTVIVLIGDSNSDDGVLALVAYKQRKKRVRVENYAEVVVPQYNLDTFWSHFRMSRRVLEFLEGLLAVVPGLPHEPIPAAWVCSSWKYRWFNWLISDPLWMEQRRFGFQRILFEKGFPRSKIRIWIHGKERQIRFKIENLFLDSPKGTRP